MYFIESQPQHDKEEARRADLKLRDNSLITSTSMVAASILHQLENIYGLAMGLHLSMATLIIRNIHT